LFQAAEISSSANMRVRIPEKVHMAWANPDLGKLGAKGSNHSHNQPTRERADKDDLRT
jgi:hypothetical protein